MNFKIAQPPPHLADYIRFFWFSEGNASIHNPFVHHAFAYPCPEIIFCYKGQFKYNVASGAEKILVPGIYGQTQTFGKVASTTDFGVFGFYLYAHALPQLFSLPASELTNQSADIKTFCGDEGEILEEKIMLASSFDQRVKIVCDFLEARLKNIRTEQIKIFSAIKLVSNFTAVTSVKKISGQQFFIGETI